MTIRKEFNSDIDILKHKVLVEVSRATYNDLGDEYLDKIPRIIIPGFKPHFRCCVYKEREIIRQRIKHATNLSLQEDSTAIIEVINEACHGCPLARFQVTSNCQKCLLKGCIKACKFGAITMTPLGAQIDQSKCKECGKCVNSCPYNAITDIQRPCMKRCHVNAIGYLEEIDEHTHHDNISDSHEKIAYIKRSKCILCGNCVKDCPFGAISYLSSIVPVIRAIKSGKPVIAMVAPSIIGQFGQIGYQAIRKAIIQLGFTDCLEVAIGADAVAIEESKEIMGKMEKGEVSLTSCCPSFVNLIKIHYPNLLDKVSKTVSPMVILNQLLKKANPEICTVFIGPCIAKKGEARDNDVDYALTFEELAAMLEAKEVVFESDNQSTYSSSVFGRDFAQTGGVTKALVDCFKREGISPRCVVANGLGDCIKNLIMLKANRFEGEVLEGMSCCEGCVGGHASLLPVNQVISNGRQITKTETDSKSMVQSVKDAGFKIV